MIQVCTCVNIFNRTDPPKVDPECPVHGSPVPSKMYITPCERCAALEAENKELRRQLESSESIRIAEKKILIDEIAENKRLREENEALREILGEILHYVPYNAPENVDEKIKQALAEKKP